MKNLKEILEQHALWLKGEGGARADLRGADLRNVNLSKANLSNADLSNADLSNANLRSANLSNADLRNVNLWNANLSNANLWNANLRDTDLSDTDLSDADLRNADLWDAKGNRSEVKSMQLETFDATYTAKVMQIGCKRFTFDEWWAFTDEEINAMDPGALSFWHKWKGTLKQIVEMSPAAPTGKED